MAGDTYFQPAESPRALALSSTDTAKPPGNPRKMRTPSASAAVASRW